MSCQLNCIVSSWVILRSSWAVQWTLLANLQIYFAEREAQHYVVSCSAVLYALQDKIVTVSTLYCQDSPNNKHMLVHCHGTIDWLCCNLFPSVASLKSSSNVLYNTLSKKNQLTTGTDQLRDWWLPYPRTCDFPATPVSRSSLLGKDLQVRARACLWNGGWSAKIQKRSWRVPEWRFDFRVVRGHEWAIAFGGYLEHLPSYFAHC